MKPAKLIKPFVITKPDKFRLSDHDPAETCGLDIEKDEVKAMLAQGLDSLSDLQERLYAQDRWAVLLILQGMDAAGKDGVVKHVMTGVNPLGCQAYAFKVPTAEELDHDFLWRCAVRLPERGRIGIFNRSYYEEVLVVRVHPAVLARQKLPPRLVDDHIWKHRFKDINSFERHLARNGTVVLKFFLNLSKAEQKRRFLERLDEPDKRWKFEAGDVVERQSWDHYMEAYEDMIQHTSTEHAPWHVVPADNKWFARLVVSAAIVDALNGLELEFPKVEGEALTELEKARAALEGEEHKGRG